MEIPDILTEAGQDLLLESLLDFCHPEQATDNLDASEAVTQFTIASHQGYRRFV